MIFKAYSVTILQRPRSESLANYSLICFSVFFFLISNFLLCVPLKKSVWPNSYKKKEPKPNCGTQFGGEPWILCWWLENFPTCFLIISILGLKAAFTNFSLFFEQLWLSEFTFLLKIWWRPSLIHFLIERRQNYNYLSL